jgi:hypothetical protein
VRPSHAATAPRFSGGHRVGRTGAGRLICRSGIFFARENTAQDEVLGEVLIDKPSWHAMPGGFCISSGHFAIIRTGDTHMSHNTPQDHISRKRVVYSLPGMDAVTMRRDEEYSVTDAGALTMDLYYPPDSTRGARTPAVIFVTGFNDAGAQRMLGCRMKEMGSYISWAQVTAASGLVGITYTNRDPAADVHAVLRHIQQNAAALGVDDTSIGLWACSGNAPTALSVLMQDGRQALKCAVLCYPYLLDLDASTGTAAAARQFGFVDACAGKSVDDLPPDIPLFIARAGQDQMPGLNDALDCFLVKALTCNLPITFVNHSLAPHAFDLFDDSETSREIIKRTLAFLQFHLGSGSV